MKQGASRRALHTSQNTEPFITNALKILHAAWVGSVCNLLTYGLAECTVGLN